MTATSRPSGPSPDPATRAGESVPGLPGPGWFVASFLAYVVLGLVLRSVVLNWVVGPLWLLVTLVLLPGAARALRRAVAG